MGKSDNIVYDIVRKSEIFKQVYLIVKSLVNMTISLDDANFKNRFVPLINNKTNEYCSLLRSHKEGSDICNKCDELHRRIAIGEKNPAFYRCDFGLMDIVIPIRSVFTNSSWALPECGRVTRAQV